MLREEESSSLVLVSLVLGFGEDHGVIHKQEMSASTWCMVERVASGLFQDKNCFIRN